MGSATSTSSYLTNLLQTLSAVSPQLSSVLSTPKVQSALAQAPQGDLVQLSEQALQLQEVGWLFANVDGTQPTGFDSVSDPLFPVLPPVSSDTASDSILQAFESSIAAGTSGAVPVPRHLRLIKLPQPTRRR